MTRFIFLPFFFIFFIMWVIPSIAQYLLLDIQWLECEAPHLF